MSSPTSHQPFDLHQRQVEAMIDAEFPFGQVEDAIDATALTADQKAALWMLAWSRIAPDDREPRATGRLALVRER